MWGFYATVTIAVLGFTVGSERVALDQRTTRMVQLGFAVFAFANMVAVVASQAELRAMAETI